MKYPVLPLACLILVIQACGLPTLEFTPVADRLASIPATVDKRTPSSDFWPPVATAGWSQPEPLPPPVNTPGGEDSPFLTSDGKNLYFFFTPDLTIPVEKQLLDGVTGIWVADLMGDGWSEPERVLMSDPGELALDGCEFVLGDLMYFCTAREGYTGIQWFRSELRDGSWQDWHYAGEELKQNEYQLGELHISADGQELYFHSPRSGGFGGMDIWVSQITPAGWGEPVNLGSLVNTDADEGWPFISPDGQELWFNGQSNKGYPGPAIFCSHRQPDGSWSLSEEIISTFAGEPTLSSDGGMLYFVHHFFSEDLSSMLESDIYITYRIP